MAFVTRLWGAAMLGALAGAAVALGVAYAYSRPVIEFWVHSPYVSAASQGKLNVAVLRHLRAGDISGATEVMENRLSLD